MSGLLREEIVLENSLLDVLRGTQAFHTRFPALKQMSDAILSAKQKCSTCSGGKTNATADAYNRLRVFFANLQGSDVAFLKEHLKVKRVKVFYKMGDRTYTKIL